MADPEIDPFEAMGGGVKIAGGGWVPKNHPLAQTAAVGTPGTEPPGGQPNIAPGAPNTEGSLAQQAANAQTYSSTPGAAPSGSMTNQGTVDVVRNSYLQQATQGTNVDRTDPNFRQQVDPFAAAVERQRRNYLSDQAESAGPYATGALRGQARMASERAGQAVGSFESELVGRELQNRRQEIQNALSNLGSMAGTDLERQLRQQLAELNAAIQRHGIDTGAATAQAGLSLQERLAQMQNELARAQMAQQQGQFENTFGLNVGNSEAYWNNLALQNLFQ